MNKNCLDPDRMTTRQLQEWLELMLSEEEEENRQQLDELLEQKILIEGKSGRGKTTAGTCLAYDMKAVFERPVVVIGSRMGLTSAFGKFQEINEQEFIDQLKSMNMAGAEKPKKAYGKELTDFGFTQEEEEENAEQIYKYLISKGVSIMYALVIFDEAGNLFERLTPNEKLVRLAGAYIARCRHYYNTAILLAPDQSELTPRVVRQMDWIGTCFYNKYTEIEKVHLKQGYEDIHLEWDTENEFLGHPKYHDMFNSHTLVVPRNPLLMEKKKQGVGA